LEIKLKKKLRGPTAQLFLLLKIMDFCKGADKQYRDALVYVVTAMDAPLVKDDSRWTFQYHHTLFSVPGFSYRLFCGHLCCVLFGFSLQKSLRQRRQTSEIQEMMFLRRS
jgi:hypothetical protein